MKLAMTCPGLHCFATSWLSDDIVRFFPNVDHEILLTLIRRTVRDQRLLDLIQRIVASGQGILDEEATPTYFPGDDLFAVLRPRGLPIGNLTSQFFANVLRAIIGPCLVGSCRPSELLCNSPQATLSAGPEKRNPGR